MIKRMLSSLVALALIALPLSAAKDIKETERLENCGTVLKEIMDIPDDIPQELIDKAECIIVFPSVIKAAFVFGASYGRGAMTCRTGEHFTGPWSAPTMMALEGPPMPPPTSLCAPKYSAIPAIAASSPASRWKAQRFARMKAPTRKSTASSSRRNPSFSRGPSRSLLPRRNSLLT